MSVVETWFSQKSVSNTFMVFLICSLVASICYFTLLWRESNFESDLTGALLCIMLRPPWRTALDWNTFTSFLIYLSYCYRFVSCGKFTWPDPGVRLVSVNGAMVTADRERERFGTTWPIPLIFSLLRYYCAVYFRASFY